MTSLTNQRKVSRGERSPQAPVDRSRGHRYDEDGYLVDGDGSLVYFIQEQGGARRIKIGYTTNLRARFAQICTGSSERLAVIHTEPGGKPREKHFHRLWKRFHHHLEWHNPGAPILAYVARAPEGRRGRLAPSPRAIPWGKILRPLGVTPRGAVRLLVGLLLLLGPKKYRKRKVRRRAWISIPTFTGSGAAYVYYGTAALWGIVPVILVACYLAGRER